MLATLESYIHSLRRRLSRSEWAIRRFKLGASANTGEKPGLLLLQIDGLSRFQLESAIAQGKMPYLRKIQEIGAYRVHTFYSGMPSTTPAVQAELYWGVRAAVPAFSFLDRARGEVNSLFDPECARRLEAVFSEGAEGLLEGGSSWSNIYGGGAAEKESHFCITNLGLSTILGSKKFGSLLLFLILEIPALFRIASLVVLELLIGLSDAVWGILHGRRIFLEMGMILSRMCVGIALREVVTVGAKIDLARGLPIVHVNFLGYDELSHRRGPGSRFAHWSLRGIDKAIENLCRAAHRSIRRDYQVWIFSDHGQEHSSSFASMSSGGVQDILADCLNVARVEDPGFTQPPQRWPLARRAARRRPEPARRAFADGRPFIVTAMGPVANVYLATPLDEAQLEAFASKLVQEVPGVLYAKLDGSVVWRHAGGASILPNDDVPALADHPEPLRRQIAEDLMLLATSTNAGDLLLLGWGGKKSSWTFAPERGSHAGPGIEEATGFVLLPNHTKLPAGTEHFIRPAAFRHAARALLGRDKLDSPSASHHVHPTHLTVMSYNVHSCIGTDGRVSPRRIARVISQHAPDVVAVQELDHGRSRSRAEDQAGDIAAALGYHLAFCPTVIRGEERYGHALLSRWPMEIVRMAPLPSFPGGIWPEPRAAIWCRITIGHVRLNVLSTHLGLSAAERLEQMKTILGDLWLGPLLKTEPVLLCGDFNLTPGSPAHRLAAVHLRDVAHEIKRGVRTFSSLRLVAQLDHIFVSPHFQTEAVFASQNEITRVASDHLPLVAKLRMMGSE